MDGDQFISKNRKRGNQSVDDLLTDLPLSIIHCILARLPIQDAIRTCILSSKWRYIWATLPHLVFDNTCVDYDGDSDWEDRMNKFITSALFLHKGPIHKFRLSAALHRPDIDQWLLHLSRNEIREIIIEYKYRYYDTLLVHSCLYSCQKLTHLELLDCILRPLPPTFKGFPFLKSLVLHGAEVPSNTLESLVAKSPLLEKFTYETSLEDSELRLSAPKLKYFHYTGSFKKMSLDAPLVAEVFVKFTDVELLDEELRKSPVCNYTNILAGCTNLERLTAKCYFTEYLSIGIESNGHSLVFRHLKFIRLDRVSFIDMKQMSVLGYLIMGAPNLQQLKISSWIEDASGSPSWIEDAPGSPNSFSDLDFGCPPNFTLEKLRVVSIKHVCGVPYEMEFIRHLLKISPVLETMNLYYWFDVLYEARLNPATKVVRCRRASPNAEIFLLEPL